MTPCVVSATAGHQGCTWLGRPSGPLMAGAVETPPGPVTSLRFRPRRSVPGLVLPLVPLLFLSVASAVGALLAPRLLTTNPLLLVVLSPKTLHLAVAAGAVPLPLFLAVGLLRLAAGDPWHYALGRTHGPAMAGALARQSAGLGAAARWLLSLGERKGLLAVALYPTGKVLVVAGAARISPSRVAVADAAGTLFQLALIYGTGRPLLAAVNLSPRTLALVGAAALVVGTAGPVVAAEARSRARRSLERRLEGTPSPRTIAP